MTMLALSDSSSKASKRISSSSPMVFFCKALSCSRFGTVRHKAMVDSPTVVVRHAGGQPTKQTLGRLFHGRTEARKLKKALRHAGGNSPREEIRAESDSRRGAYRVEFPPSSPCKRSPWQR